MYQYVSICINMYQYGRCVILGLVVLDVVNSQIS